MKELPTVALLTVVLPIVLGQTTATRPVEPSAAVQAILRYIPDDAHLVLLVPSLSGLAEGIQAFGLAVGAEELADITPMRVLAGALGESAAGGLDPTGALAVVLSAKWDDPLLVATLADKQAWDTAGQPRELRAGVNLYDFGGDRFVAVKVGRAVIFARDQGELTRALDASGVVARRVCEEAGERLGRHHLLLFVDVPGWKDLIETRTAWLAQRFYVGMAAAGPEAELGMQIWSWMFDQLRQAIVQMRTALAGLRIEATGVSAEFRLDFQPDGSIARYLGGVRCPQRELLRGLPTGPGAMIVAFEWEESPESRGFNEGLVRAMLATPALKEKFGGERLQDVLERGLEINRRVPGTSFVFGSSQDQAGLLYWGLYLTAEGPTVRRELRHICESMPELAGAWGTMPAALKLCPREQIGDAEVDAYALSLGEDMSALQPVMQAIYGAEPRFYLAAHPEGLAYSFGPQEESRRKLAELLASAGPLAHDPRVAAVLARLSPHPQGCVLLDPPAMLRSVLDLARRLGVPVPRPENGSACGGLAGLTFYLEARAVRAEVFVPADAVRATLRLVEQMRPRGDTAR